MHINNIVHRDLKPGNIMAINSNRFVLADYGEGLNLSYEDVYSKQLCFQKGNYPISGTADYLDPIYKAHYLWCKENNLKEA